MTVAAEKPRRNGTVVSPPINTVVIELEDRWPGWSVTMRTDPPSSVIDRLLAFDEEGKWWKAFGEIVIAWTITDEAGEPLPLPKDAESEHVLDLRYGFISNVFARYMQAIRDGAAVPKVPAAVSSTTSSTNGVSQGTA